MRTLFFFFAIGLFCLSTSSSGQSMHIDSIRFVGNEKTRENILRRELDFQEHDSLSIQDLNDRIEFNRRKLMNTNLFIWVKSDYHQLPNGNLSIQFEFLEQWYVLAYPIFQLADRNLNDWWSRGHDFNRAIYGLHFLHNNFMGRNEKVVIKAETGFTQKLELSYQNPYLDPQKTLGLTVNLAYTTQKNLAFKTNRDTLNYLNSNEILREKWTGGLQFKKRFKFYDFQTLEIKYTHSIIADTIAKLNPSYFGNGKTEQNYAQIGYAFSYDFRDFVTYPLRGKKIDIGFTKYGLLPNDQVDFWEASAAVAYFFDLGSRFFLASQIKTKLSRDGFIPYANTRGLGYGNDLVRGYELNVIDGTNFFLWRNTFKFQLISTVLRIPFIKYKQFNQMPIAIYPTAFSDLGYVYNSNRETRNSTNQWLFGTGLGFDFVTYYNFVCKLGFPITNGGKTGMVVSIGREF
jgi:outer membrane protein assembly factor BamA